MGRGYSGLLGNKSLPRLFFLLFETWCWLFFYPSFAFFRFLVFFIIIIPFFVLSKCPYRRFFRIQSSTMISRTWTWIKIYQLNSTFLHKTYGLSLECAKVTVYSRTGKHSDKLNNASFLGKFWHLGACCVRDPRKHLHIHAGDWLGEWRAVKCQKICRLVPFLLGLLDICLFFCFVFISYYLMRWGIHFETCLNEMETCLRCENEFNGLFVLSFICLSQGSGSEMKREERERARERQTSRQGRKHRKSLVPPKAFIVLLFITISCLSSNFSVYSHRIFVPSRPGR